MSNKTKVTGASSSKAPQREQDAPTTLPKLRFPEFRDAEGWEHKLIGPHLVDCSGRVPPDTKLPIYSSTREGLKRQDAYFDGRVLQNKNEYGVVPTGCLVYRHMSDDGLFKFNINETGGEIAVSKEYPVFSTKGLNSVFLLATLNDGPDFKQFALSQKAGGTRTRLYFSRLCEWRTTLPSLPEQHKIAECLSSMDELIAAQARKLDALKTHRKGLMKQLFPREGETQPRLRFPEFQDAGEWAVEPFQLLYEFKPTNTYSRDQLNYDSGTAKNIHYGDIHMKFATAFHIKSELIPFVNASESLAKVKSDAYCKEGDMVFADASEDLTDVGKSIEIVDLNGEKVLSGSHTILARQKRNALVTGFAGYLFKSRGIRTQIEKEAQGTKVMAISPGRLAGITVCFPPNRDEQQRIADCLTFLDDLIAAQTQKLDALKTHKKGLMQQLFPSPEEVEA